MTVNSIRNPHSNQPAAISRRDWVTRCATAGLAGVTSLALRARPAEAAASPKAQIAITLDLEMSRNFPRWEDTFWDYEKGNLNDETKRYSVEAARRVKAAGGVLHFFAVGRVFEQENVDWLKQIVEEGHYPSHANTKPMEQPGVEVIDSIIAAQAKAQPIAYPDGLIEVPMSPISDIGAFRTGQWRLEWFLTAIREAVEWAISTRAVFDFLAHPSCLYVVDPDFKSIELICKLVRDNGDRAAIVDLGAIANQVRAANGL